MTHRALNINVLLLSLLSQQDVLSSHKMKKSLSVRGCHILWDDMTHIHVVKHHWASVHSVQHVYTCHGRDQGVTTVTFPHPFHLAQPKFLVWQLILTLFHLLWWLCWEPSNIATMHQYVYAGKSKTISSYGQMEAHKQTMLDKSNKVKDKHCFSNFKWPLYPPQHLPRPFL